MNKSKKEFIDYIKSLGFICFDVYFKYKGFSIIVDYRYYDFWDGSNWVYNIPHDNLELLRKFDRSYKIRKILKINEL